MKKRLLLSLACTLILGVSGCMEENVNLNLNGNAVFSEDFDSEINKKEEELITELITDVNSKYNETFKAYHFIPSKKGFNTDASKNYILAENEEGLKIYIAKRNDAEESYLENYKHVKFAEIVKEEFEKHLEFEGEIAVKSALKEVDLEGATVEEILANSYETTLLLQVPFEINNESIKEIYKFYNALNNYKENHIHYLITSGPNNKKSSEYMNQYSYYKFQERWEDFDKNIKQTILLDTTDQLDFESFKSYLKEVN